MNTWICWVLQAQAIDAHGFVFHGVAGDIEEYARIGYPTAGVFGDWDIAVVADYARDPLTEESLTGRVPVVPALGTATLAGAFSFGGLRLDLSLPTYPLGMDPGGSFAAIGDMRVGALVPIPWFNPDIPRIGLHTAISIPTGSEAHFVSSGGVRFEGAALVAKEFGPVGVIGMLGGVVSQQEEERNLQGGAGPLFGLGASFRFGERVATALELTGESEYGFSSLPIETTLSARYRLPVGAWATAGGAVGLTDGVGSSRWRVFAGVGWSRRQAEHVELQLEEVSVDADRDGDGIPDQDDICPDQPETVDLVEDQDGCPELDGDQDGVPFAKDNCPTQPTLPGQDPRYSDGCPRVAELAGDRIVITETIFFEEGKSVLMPGSERVLSAILNILQEHPTLGPVLVAGHTNVNGSDSFNLRLSDARAFEVMRWLVDHGIEPERLVSKGFGEEFPLVPESNPDAERINRRVEFQVLNAGIPEGARRVQLSPEALAARAARQTEPPVIVEVPVSAPVTPPEPVAEEKKEEPTRPRRKPADTSDHR